jgi:hypothetical protein
MKEIRRISLEFKKRCSCEGKDFLDICFAVLRVLGLFLLCGGCKWSVEI